MSTPPDPRGRAAATRQKLARFPAAVHIFVADATINIAMKQIAAAFVRYKPEAGRWPGRIAADAEARRVESYDDAGARERRTIGRRSAPITAAHGGCWPAGHIRVILAL